MQNNSDLPLRITYRPEIDGLRALSVFAVVLYHSNFFLFEHAVFQGGFIGVDIFFLISGYLITSLILKEIYYTKKFNLNFFYERRARRILPIFLFVTILTSVLSYFILLPSSLLDFGKSIFSVLIFSSNFYFWFTGNQYGQESELLRPLLHTWSLSVEEQFYILFPIFLIIIIKSFKKNISKILFLLFLISFIFSAYLSKFFPSFSFYIFPSRVFEFLFGSLMAYLQLKKNSNRLEESYSISSSLCVCLGFLLIIYSFLFFTFTKISHPSFVTLIPIIGASLVIWFSKKDQLLTKILSSKIFVFCGLISYSLYLWHYPIFAYLRYLEIFDNSIRNKLLAIILTIVLSIISYYFIEQPFRNRRIISKKFFCFLIIFGFVILISYSICIIKTKGFKDRFPNIISEDLKASPGSILVFNKFYNPNSVLLIGDSHADSLRFYLSKKLMEKNYNYHAFTTPLYILGFKSIDPKTGDSSKEFEDTNIRISKFLKNINSQIVVLHHYWPAKLLDNIFLPIHVSNTSFEEKQKYLTEGLKSTVQNILNQDNHVIIVYPVPEMTVNVPRIVLSKYLSRKSKLSAKDNFDTEVLIVSIDYDLYKIRNKKVFEILDNIQGPNVYRVYPDKFFCNTMIKNKCIANTNEHLFYYDSNHLSLEGSKYVVNDIIKIIKLIEVNKHLNLQR